MDVRVGLWSKLMLFNCGVGEDSWESLGLQGYPTSPFFFFFFFSNFIFKLYIIVLVLPNIKMNPPQVYMCSPSRTLLPTPSPYHPSGPSQCTSPKHPASCIEPGLNQSVLKEISPGYWKDWCWTWDSNTLATWCEELTHWKRPWCWEGLGAGGEGDDRGWDGWMASLTWWTFVWVNSGSWWWTGRPGMLRFMGSQ